MPIGIILNSLAILLGGIVGAAIGKKIPAAIRTSLPLVFGCCAMMMGITNIIKMKTMPAVVLALIIGTIIGELLKLEDAFQKVGAFFGPKVAKLFGGQSEMDENHITDFVSTLVLFCASGTGIFGAMQSGLNGDHTLLITKAILDFFTAAIMAVTVGYLTAFISIPQTVIFLALFFSAKLLMPIISDVMLADFMCCGGVLVLAAGFRVAKVKNFPISSMVPAMILVMPVSAAWNAWILPLFG